MFSHICLMMREYKRRSVTCVEEDRIGNLPAHLTDSILERLPIQEAVRTSILSKNWRYRWTTMRELVFDENFSTKYAKNGAFGRNGFIRIINQVVFRHKGPPIVKFHLHIPDINLDSFQEVDLWMLFLSRNRVTEIILTNSISNRRYQLSSHVLSCLELTNLKLKNCIIKRPIEFEGLVNLGNLDLRHIVFGDNVSGTQISLPQLKMLSLCMCSNASNFSIKATKLWCLAVESSLDAWPSVQGQVVGGGSSVALFALQDFVGEERKNLGRGISHFPRMEVLIIEGIFLKFLFAENVPKWLPHPVNSLKHLSLGFLQLGDMDQLYGALCLLRNSPNLKHLYLENHVDVGPSLKHLESPNCLDCTLNQLKDVGITYLQGSRPELLFIKLLLAHSPFLEEITITPTSGSGLQKRFDILKDITRFPRASPNAKMFFLNPWP